MSEILEDREVFEKYEPSEALRAKLRAIDQELREETGGVVLFGVFEREDVPGRWDVLVAADWVGPDVARAVAYVAGKIQEKLTPDELVPLAGVVALRPVDPFVRLVTRAIRINGGAYLENNVFNGIPVARAWIFTANLDSHSDFQPPPYVGDQQVGAKAKSTTGGKAAPRLKPAQPKR